MEKTFGLDTISQDIEEGIDPIYAVPTEFTHIADGSDSVVYRYSNDAVVKFSLRPTDTHNQTIREAEFYQQVQNTPVSHLFAEVYSHTSTRYLIQEYVNTRRNVSEQAIGEWKDEVNSYGISVHDDRPQNFGYRGNTLVMVDYAGCYFES